jgi:hypothetical protein
VREGHNKKKRSGEKRKRRKKKGKIETPWEK